ncbi:hypothetical protein PVAND_017322 [Polypedilum vanderplanki]|uniref:Leucine rich repeat protein n=1 Tax=Polypedilum vanderplanki TaxID=319348 RepID=A0A9J6BIQ5_POLVA|nr:hypothetical protein PVAND_017322 [Polypedilum vanderplanki]
MKFLKFVSIIFIPLTFAINLDCIFDYQRSDFLGEIYFCNVTNNFTITAPETFITSVNGTHLPTLDNSYVQEFYSKNHIVNFMPYGLTKFFPNLAEISILNAEMKEIHQKDFQQYPNLVGFNLTNNNITRIEKDLFKFNPDMSFFAIWHNPIKEIHPKVFDQFYDVFDRPFWFEINYDNCTGDDKYIHESEIQKNILKCKPQHYFELSDDKKIDLEEIDENIEKYKKKINKINLDIAELKNEIFVLVIFIPLTFAINLDCIFDYQRSDFLGEIYFCNVTNNFTITAPETFITSVNGTHLPTLDNSYVQEFYSKNHIVNFMPYGLTKFFPNLAEISF